MLRLLIVIAPKSQAESLVDLLCAECDSTLYFTLQQVAGLLRRNMGYSLPRCSLPHLWLPPPPPPPPSSSSVSSSSSSDIAVGATKLVATPPPPPPHYTATHARNE